MFLYDQQTRVLLRYILKYILWTYFFFYLLPNINQIHKTHFFLTTTHLNIAKTYKRKSMEALQKANEQIPLLILVDLNESQ